MAEETTAATITEALTSAPAGGEGVNPENVRQLKDPAKPDAGGFVWGTGRRKTAVARVRLRPAKDKAKPRFLVNGKPVDVYFTELRDQNACHAPLKDAGVEGVDIYCKAHGGGYMGQAGAVRLGVARALVGLDPTLEAALRNEGHLTRDAREVERKKYGQRGARRRFQFSKR